MQSLRINSNSFLFLLLCICIILFSINYEVITSFRLLDICFLVLCISFLLSNPKLNKVLSINFGLIILFFSISNFIGLYIYNSFDISKLGFIYKYILIFATPWILISIVRTKRQIKIINWLLLINFIFLSSWTYIYLALLADGTIHGSFRPSFPLSSDYMSSDAHLYSSYLGFFIVVYLFYLRIFFKHHLFSSLVIMINGLIGLILTGSRTGLVIVGLSILIYKLYIVLKMMNVNNKLIIQQKILMYILVLIIAIFCVSSFFTPLIYQFFDDYDRLLQRSFDFDLGSDDSSLGRIKKLLIAIDDAEYSGLLLGIGLSCSLVWYDGLLSILLAHGGILFIISILTFYYFAIKKLATKTRNQKDFLLFLLLVILYFISNIITEYIFVSRNAFPILSILSVIYANILMDESNRIENQN